MGELPGLLSAGREGRGLGEGACLTGEARAALGRAGLELSARDLAALGEAQAEALAATGRFELGPGALPCIASELARSPFLAQDLLVGLLARALAAFYELRGELDASVSDEEVARALRVALDRSQGDADAFDEVTAEDVVGCRDGGRWGDWPDDGTSCDDGACRDGACRDGACRDGGDEPDGGWAILQDAPWGDDWRDGLPSGADEGEGRE